MTRVQEVISRLEHYGVQTKGIKYLRKTLRTKRKAVTILYLIENIGLDFNEAIAFIDHYYPIRFDGSEPCQSTVAKWHASAREKGYLISDRASKVVYEGKINVFGQNWIVFSAIPFRKAPQTIHCPVYGSVRSCARS
jgi:hypothetical protein